MKYPIELTPEEEKAMLALTAKILMFRFYKITNICVIDERVRGQLVAKGLLRCALDCWFFTAEGRVIYLNLKKL